VAGQVQPVAPRVQPAALPPVASGRRGMVPWHL